MTAPGSPASVCEKQPTLSPESPAILLAPGDLTGISVSDGPGVQDMNGRSSVRDYGTPGRSAVAASTSSRNESPYISRLDGSCWARNCESCRPSHAAGYAVAECSCVCCCGWTALWPRLLCGCCVADLCLACPCRAELPNPAWSCAYFLGFQWLKRLIRHFPRGNLYCVQGITSLPCPTAALPGDVLVSAVRSADFSGEWLTLAGAPKGLRRTILYFHGGGFMACSASNERMVAAYLLKAAGSGCRLLSAEYPLVPANPHPAPVNSAIASWRWLRKNQGVPAADIVVAGDSAGGCIAVALALKLHELGEERPKALVLLSPFVSLCPIATSSWALNEKYDYIGDPALVAEVAGLYAGSAKQSDPFVAPLNAARSQLAGLPPLWISAGGAEVLLSSIELFAERVQKAGVQVSLYIAEGMAHVFQIFYWAFKPPRAELLPRCCCCCDGCLTAPPPTAAGAKSGPAGHSVQWRPHPVWEAYESLSRFLVSPAVWPPAPAPTAAAAAAAGAGQPADKA
eukprot:TRINITY_DN7802_c0_g1_i1.p1 TRINITY_DN7802_c0_g1~~TRINITY_DN7802_c0_g1_i1.p1  ORF type:complete len:513 (+),score=51.04 TRINITY_DN7802_c0_g1_i1:94-1632(+)